MQGSAAEVTLAALGRLPGALQGTGARLINLVHDELVLEVDAEAAQALAQRLVDAMTEGFLAIFPAEADLTQDLVEATAFWRSASGKRRPVRC